MTRKQYRVEAWKGLDCIAFTTKTKPEVVIREADAYAVDNGADRVYVRRVDLSGSLVADRDPFRWRRVDDPDLRAVLIERGEIDPDE